MERKNIKELAREVASKTEMPIVTCEQVLRASVEAIKENLVEGNEVNLYGLGVFSVVEVDARIARNPKTGEQVEVEAHNKPKFRFVASVKESVR